MITPKEELHQKFLNPALPKIATDEIFNAKTNDDFDYLEWAVMKPERLENPDEVIDLLFKKTYIRGRISLQVFRTVLEDYPLSFLQTYLPDIVDVNKVDSKLMKTYNDANLIFTHKASPVINFLIGMASEERLNFFLDSKYFITEEIGRKIPIYLYDLGYGSWVGKCGLNASFSDNDNAVRFIYNLEGRGLCLNTDPKSPLWHNDPLCRALRGGRQSVVYYLLSGMSTYTQNKDYILSIFDETLELPGLDILILEFVQKMKRTWLDTL